MSTTTSTQAPTEKMKMSEAIRKGAQITKPLRGDIYSRMKEMDEPVEYSCAMGAAFMGVVPQLVRRTRGDIDSSGLAWRWFGVRLGMIVPFPTLSEADRAECSDLSLGYLDDLASQEGGVALDTAIVALNDRARWSRERIADWLESMGL